MAKEPSIYNYRGDQSDLLSFLIDTTAPSMVISSLISFCSSSNFFRAFSFIFWSMFVCKVFLTHTKSRPIFLAISLCLTALCISRINASASDVTLKCQYYQACMPKMASTTKMTDIFILHEGKEYTFKVHETEIGYWARCNELRDAITPAKTLDELAKNMKQALILALRPIPLRIKKKIEAKKP